MSAKKAQVVYDPWETYVAQAEQGPIFISFDEGATREDLSDSLPHCARVIIPIKDPNENGGPVEPENERLWQMEDELCEMLGRHGVVCRLVGRLTCAGDRELVFQLRDWEQFRPPVGQWMVTNPDYEIGVSEHGGWEFFDTCIRPTPAQWLFIMDRRVVDNLTEAGSDPEKEHALEYVFTGASDGLRKTAAALQARGYQPHQTLDFDKGEIVMVKSMKLDVGEIADESVANHELAKKNGVVCSGWGAMVVE